MIRVRRFCHSIILPLPQGVDFRADEARDDYEQKMAAAREFLRGGGVARDHSRPADTQNATERTQKETNPSPVDP